MRYIAKCVLVWISALLLMALCAPRAGAATYYLDPARGSDGNPGTQSSPWKTLYKVKTTVDAGDTVNILGGTYTQAQVSGTDGVPNWYHTQSLGTANNPITIQANPGESVTFDGQWRGYWQRFYATGTYGGHYVVVKNLTFKNYAGSAISLDGASAATPAHHLAVIGCTFQDFNDSQAGALIAGQHASHVVFRGNTFTNIGHPAFGGQGIPTSQHAIYIAENTHYVVADQNRMEQISGYGVHSWGHSDYSVTTRNVIVRQNTIVNVYASSIITAGTNYADVYIYHNTMYQEPSPFPAIDAQNADAMVNFHNGGRYTTMRILNNIGYGTVSLGPLNQEDQTQFTGLLLDHNLWGNVRDQARTINWDRQAYTVPGFRAATGYEAHAVTSDPRFVNATGRDFHLQPGSPAIDSGMMLTTTVGAGSGTTLTVADAGFFTDGYGLVAGDMIQVGSNGPAQIVAIQSGTNAITLARSLTWSAGQGVALSYAGARPDMGAHESGGTGRPPLPAPTNLRMIQR